MVKKFAAALFLALALLAASGPSPRDNVLPPTPSPIAGPELWRDLPPELLQNVIEGIMERRSEAVDRYDRELDLVRRIQREKLGTCSIH